MLGVVEDLVEGAVLHHAARVHHDDAVGHVGHDAEVVGHEDDPRVRPGAQILELLHDLQQRLGTSILMITHDLGVIAETVRRVVVMYAGEVVEHAEVRTLFAEAHHPYTEGLLRAMPRVGERRERLAVIPGTVPPPTAWPTGCRFHDRCPYAWERCAREHPPLYQLGGGHTSRCHLADEPERRAHPHPPLVAQEGA